MLSDLRLACWYALGDVSATLGWTRLERAADDMGRRIILRNLLKP